MGPHEIHLRILKMLLMSLQNLSMIFEQSWESRGVPGDWKLTNVPVFKNKEDLGSHRPVSLTSVPSQIMEEMILGSTEKHLEDNAGISHSQHSFMRGKSCLLNLTSFCDRMTHLADPGKPVDVTFWTSAKLWILSLPVTFWTNCPARRLPVLHDG